MDNPVKVYFENSLAIHIATMEDAIYSHPLMQAALESIKTELGYELLTDSIIEDDVENSAYDFALGEHLAGWPDDELSPKEAFELMKKSDELPEDFIAYEPFETMANYAYDDFIQTIERLAQRYKRLKD